jgi:hypothetical protein
MNDEGMNRRRAEMPDDVAAKTELRRKKRKPFRAALWADIAEVEKLTDRIHYGIVHERLVMRIAELEGALDFYAWGPSPKGELEPMRGEAYAKAMAADGGAIARAYLKGRLDRSWFGERNKHAPGGWGTNLIGPKRAAVSAEEPR